MALQPMPLVKKPDKGSATGDADLSLLSDKELLARIFVARGQPSNSTLMQAERVLNHIGGAAGLIDAPVESFKDIKKLPSNLRIRILAARELFLRAERSAVEQGAPVRAPADFYRLVKTVPLEPGKETFGIFLLNTKNKPLKYHIVSVGCLDQSLVHPREVFREAVAESAASVLLFHNHPSGDPEPSPEDQSMTKQLVAAGDMLGIRVVDHLVLGLGGKFVSMKERGLM